MRRLVICALLVVLTSALGWLAYTTYALWRDPDTLPIEKVQVEGTFRYVNRAELEEAVLPFVQNGFLHVDVVALKERLEVFPAVKEVRIVRIWSDKLWIEVIEHQFIARWRGLGSQEVGLLSDEGVIVAIPPNEADSAMPLLIAPATQAKYVLDLSRQMTTKLATVGLHLSELKLDRRHALQAKLDNEVRLILGRETTLTRLQRFVEVYENLKPKISGKMSYIDLRYTNGIAVKFDN